MGQYDRIHVKTNLQPHWQTRRVATITFIRNLGKLKSKWNKIDSESNRIKEGSKRGGLKNKNAFPQKFPGIAPPRYPRAKARGREKRDVSSQPGNYISSILSFRIFHMLIFI